MEKDIQAQETPEDKFQLIKEGRKYFNPVNGLFYYENGLLRFDVSNYLTFCDYMTLYKMLPADAFRKIRTGKYKLRL